MVLLRLTCFCPPNTVTVTVFSPSVVRGMLDLYARPRR